jgi:hypothetical protein
MLFFFIGPTADVIYLAQQYYIVYIPVCANVDKANKKFWVIPENDKELECRMVAASYHYTQCLHPYIRFQAFETFRS